MLTLGEKLKSPCLTWWQASSCVHLFLIWVLSMFSTTWQFYFTLSWHVMHSENTVMPVLRVQQQGWSKVRMWDMLLPLARQSCRVYVFKLFLELNIVGWSVLNFNCNWNTTLYFFIQLCQNKSQLKIWVCNVSSVEKHSDPFDQIHYTWCKWNCFTKQNKNVFMYSAAWL